MAVQIRIHRGPIKKKEFKKISKTIGGPAELAPGAWIVSPEDEPYYDRMKEKGWVIETPEWFDYYKNQLISEDEAAAEKAGKEAATLRGIARRRRGRTSTILTGPAGLGSAPIYKKTLLGA